MTQQRRSPMAAEHGLLWSGLAVSAAYVCSVVMANWASTHAVALLVGSLIVPAGTLWAGVTLTLRDLLHEALGARGVTTAIMVGAALSWLLVSPQIGVASIVAFTVSEVVDSVVYSRIRVRSRLVAILGSNVVGLVSDSVLFVPMAFGSFVAVPGQILGKTVATVFTVAALSLAQTARWAVSR